VAAVRGRQHPSYQVFVHQLALPPITVADRRTLDIGVKLKIDIGQRDQLTTEGREALAVQFGVPVGLVDRFLERLGHNAQWDAEQAAQELRTTVIDYKYLQDRWTHYRPLTENQELKTNALQVLQVGETVKAWEMYLALPRPKPPTGLRMVSQ